MCIDLEVPLTRNLIRSHEIRASAVHSRLKAAENGQHLTAEEWLGGIRIPHDEYVRLVELLKTVVSLREENERLKKACEIAYASFHGHMHDDDAIQVVYHALHPEQASHTDAET